MAKLDKIVGCRLGMVRCAALHSVHRLPSAIARRPAGAASRLLPLETHGPDQPERRRAPAGERAGGMRLATARENRALLDQIEQAVIGRKAAFAAVGRAYA